MTQLADKIKARLLVDEEKIVEEALESCAPFIQLDPKGRVHLKGAAHLRGEDLVVLFLAGRRLAAVAGLASIEVATLDEVTEGTGLKRDVAVARLNDLKKRGVIESEARGSYRIIMAAIPKAIEGLTIGDEKHE